MKNIEKKLQALRREYSGETLNPANVLKDPFLQFANWLHLLMEKNPGDPNAMVLATADKQGRPSARVVLLKEFDHRGFVFYTNYNSKKGKEIDANPNASLLFYWPDLHQQVRIEGVLEKNSPEDAKNYFNERPRESRISAWISPQSHVIESKELLEEKYLELSDKYNDQEIPYPSFWGGYCLKPNLFEFWQGQPNRLHDRVQYRFVEDTGEWVIEQLAP
jgi:pyridoxamine 5'-phosphate oxidase